MDKAHAFGAVFFVIMLVSLVRSFLPTSMRSDKPIWPFSFEVTDYARGDGDLPPQSVDGHCSRSDSSSDGGSCGGGDGGSGSGN